MTYPTDGGWLARVERDNLSFGVRVLLGYRSDDGIRYLTSITSGHEQTEHVPRYQTEPDTVNLRIDEDAARALYDALAQHFSGEAGGRQTRADLMHERGRVDKLTDALIVVTTGSASLTGHR